MGKVRPVQLILSAAVLVLLAGPLVGELYYSATLQLSPVKQSQSEALASNLSKVDFGLLPHNGLARQRVRYLAGAGDLRGALYLQEQVLQSSVSNPNDWYIWLSLAISNDKNGVTELPIVSGIQLLDVLAGNDARIRLQLSRLGLKSWYWISPESRKAFRRHLDWMAAYNSKMLWGHAGLVRRERLLCRIYADDGIKLPLC
jgi:hypothetical protein